MKKLKLSALSHHIPILSDEGILFIKAQIKDRNLKTMLEIGTAVGYSSIILADDLVKIKTLERDEKLYQMAVENINTYHKTNIHPVWVDALNYEPKDTFDLLFIDAAKAQYERFFTRYQAYLNPGGIIICDNLNFHHLNPSEVSRGTRNLIKKLDKFKRFLTTHPEFETAFYDIGDGLSVSWRRHETSIHSV